VTSEVKRVQKYSSSWVALALLAALAASVAGCSRTQEVGARGDGANAIPVRAFDVTEETVRRNVQALGSLFALEESVISAEVEGRVERVLADVGDTVAQGQVLVKLVTVELEYELERQRAAVRQVRARLGLGAGDPPPADPSRVPSVVRAAAELFDAEGKYRRAQQLSADRLISQQQLDEAEARFKSARAAHDLALNEVEQLKAQLQSNEAAQMLAEKKLADASIRAPYPGAIKERRVSPGEFVRMQGPVMVIVRTDQLRARLAVPERWAGALKTGTMVDVRVEAYPNETFRGRLERINPSVSEETRMFQIEAIVPNPGGRLKPGFFAQAALPTQTEEKALTVPESAVNYRYGVYKVYVLKNGRVEERQVKTGGHFGDRIEVTEGLRAGERVAVAAEGVLTDGAAVREGTGGTR